MARPLTILLATAAVALAPFAGCRTPQSAKATEAQIESEAQKALKRMSDTLSGAKAMTFRVRGTMDEVLASGQLSQFSRTSTISIRRPDKLYVEAVGDDIVRTVWYDGQTLSMLDKSSNRYASVQAPDNIEDMIDFVIREYGLTIPVADLLFSDPYKTLTAEVQSGTHLGRRSVDGHNCHHLLFRQERINWQAWIDTDAAAVPRKLVITYKDEPGSPTFTGRLDQWDLSPKLAEDLFEFKPPAGATKVDMAELLAERQGE